jgi:hypothetical protein
MNPSANTNEQQGDPSWSTENWDNPGAVGTLDQSSNQYSSANRLEWEWDPMILAQHPGSGGSSDGPGSDGDRLLKNQITGGASPDDFSGCWIDVLNRVGKTHACAGDHLL